MFVKEGLVLFSRSVLSYCCDPVARRAPLSVGLPGKDTGSGCHFLLQEIFPTQGPNLHLLHWHVGPLLLSHQGSPG